MEHALSPQIAPQKIGEMGSGKIRLPVLELQVVSWSQQKKAAII
jgi:hypothetical protein